MILDGMERAAVQVAHVVHCMVLPTLSSNCQLQLLMTYIEARTCLYGGSEDIAVELVELYVQ